MQKDPEKRTDLSEKDLQSSSLTPVRNPFKVKTQQIKSSERETDPDAEKDRGEINGDNKRVNGKDHSSAKQKEERSKTTQIEGDGSDGQSGSDREGKESESWRKKKLPAGMKIKKRVSDDERSTTESPNSVNESETGLKHQQSSSGCDENETKDDRSNKQSTAASKSAPDKTQSSSSSCSTVSENPTALNVQKTVANQSQATRRDEEDDVQLLSTPAAPVQKTLTSYPGFQPASKAQDPGALHSHLTAQLKQKKVTHPLLFSCWLQLWVCDIYVCDNTNDSVY